jgi:ribosome-binding ATPase YchF (GTP1/OBG family)
LTVIDIAGLVKGAASGAGLGNAFLSHVRAVDAIYHVVRAFDEPDVIHVEGELDPLRDVEIIREELRLKDEEFLSKQVAEREKDVRRLGTGGNAADKAKKEEYVSSKPSSSRQNGVVIFTIICICRKSLTRSTNGLRTTRKMFVTVFGPTRKLMLSTLCILSQPSLLSTSPT